MQCQAVRAHAPLPYWSGSAIFDRAGSACRQYCSSSPALGVICWSRRAFNSPFDHRWPCVRCCRSTSLEQPTIWHSNIYIIIQHFWNPTSFNCVSLACRACDYVYINYVRRFSSLYRLLRPVNCQTYITLHLCVWVCSPFVRRQRTGLHQHAGQ